MFRFFIILIFFSSFGFVAVVPGDPETQTVSHSFPKLCAALQRKFGTDAAYRADGRYVFGLVSRDESHYQWHCLGFCSGDATPLSKWGKWPVSSSSRIAPERRQVRCGDLLGVTS
jgi:hypothetical protein